MEGKDAAELKDSVNGVTLLILLNLSLSFLKTSDNYNADRCATLALWYSDRRKKENIPTNDPVRAKLLYRRGAARYALRKDDKEVDRFKSAMSDLEQAAILEKELGGDDTTLTLLAEVRLEHEKLNGGSVPTNMEEAMHSDDWMGEGRESKNKTIVTPNDINNAIDDAIEMRKNRKVEWDVVGQLKEKFHTNLQAADWSKVPQKLVFLALLEFILVYFKVRNIYTYQTKIKYSGIK
jgi:hypothetical protein